MMGSHEETRSGNLGCEEKLGSGAGTSRLGVQTSLQAGEAPGGVA